MKKFILIVLILTLLPVMVNAAYYRFDPTEPYNLNGAGTVLDTVYLKWWYNGDSSVTHVLTAPLAGTVSTYQFDSTVAEAGDYLIWMEFVDNSESVRLAHTFTFTASDTLADTNSAWAAVADVSGLATHSQVDSLKDTVEDMSGRLLATGFSTHAQVDSLKDTVEAVSARVGDIEKISGDATAADNLEATLDGTGGVTWSMGRLAIDGANGANGSFYVRNTSGTGAIFTTSNNSIADAGLLISATAGNNYGLLFGGSGSGAGIVGLGGADAGSGMYLLGSGGGHGLSLSGNAAGDGLYAQGGANGDGVQFLGQGTGKDLNATLNLDDVSGSYDKDDYEDDFFETMSDTTRIRLDSLFTLAASLLTMVDGGNELVDLDTLLWIFTMIDSIRDSVQTQAWASVDACAGAGAYTCTLTVVDTTHDVTVSGVTVVVNNQTEDGTEYPLTSNSSGHTIVSLNNGDYRASAIGQPNVYASTDFTIAGAVLHDSILGYSPTISSPPSANVATVYGYFISGAHDTLSNMDVTFELEGFATVRDTSVDALVTAKIKRVVTDGNGKVEVSLLKNENLITADGDSLVHPWWTCKADDPTFPFTIHFTIDSDSTTFNLGVESDAVQFRKR